MLKHAKVGFCLLLMLALLPVGMVSAAEPEAGASEADIAAAQEYLRDYGYLNGVEVESGVLDEPTRSALETFQSRFNLRVTGELDVATRDLMAKPRYDHHPDPVSDDFVLWPDKWPVTALTYGFVNFTPDLTEAQTRAAIEQAFALWSAVTPLTFTEVPVTSPTVPDIPILFASGNHGDGPENAFDGPGGVLAHAYFPEQGPISGDAHFDEAETWSVTIPPVGGTFDLMTVAAHEFGHSLGLQHSDVVGALMFPFYGGPVSGLHPDDIAGIQAHYGPLVPPPGDDNIMFVTDVSLSTQTLTTRSGDTAYRLTGQVTVQAGDTPVPGALVTANLSDEGQSELQSGELNVDLQASTNANGVATFVQVVNDPGEYTLTVLDVTKGNLIYDESLNVETSASINTDGSVPVPGNDKMYVDDVSLSSEVSSGRGSASYKLTGEVTVHVAGQPVSGANVTANLTGPGANLTLNATTNASGVATFSRNVSQAGEYTLTVTNVSKAGLTYDAGLNVESSASVDTSTGEPPTPPTACSMYVSTVDLSFESFSRGTTTFHRLKGEAVILCDGEVVSGAEVTASLTGPGVNSQLVGTTKADGKVSWNFVTSLSNVVVELTVTDVEKDGMIYDASQNLDVSDSVFLP